MSVDHTLREIIAAEINIGDRYETADRILKAMAEAGMAVADRLEAEPVAWRRMNRQGTASTGITDTTFYRDLWLAEGADVRPLYASMEGLPTRDEAIREVVGLCNRIPGSTQWNAAEFMYDLLTRAQTGGAS